MTRGMRARLAACLMAGTLMAGTLMAGMLPAGPAHAEAVVPADLATAAGTAGPIAVSAPADGVARPETARPETAGPETAGPEAAAPAEAAAPTFGQKAGKTATYQAMSSFNDFLYGAIVGGGLATGGLLAAASLVTEPIIHYLHETAWGQAPPPADAAAAMERLPIKTATYAAANAGRVFTATWLLTGNPVIAVGMVAFNAVSDSLTFALNDAAWIRFGGADEAPSTAMGSAGAP
ncbi:hypothetical protein STVA_34180 [Allostella vacuolata]|nr:hypothetical protein STVA_34180 [Stella vacuolata]